MVRHAPTPDAMLKNYLTIALRNLKKHTVYTFINVFGLALGMACCIAIGLFVREEMRYDRFHEDTERLYRVALDVAFQGQPMQTAFTSRPLGSTLKTDVPEVEQATRLWRDPSGSMIVRYQDHRFAEDRVFFGDSTFFEVFALPFLQGDPKTALREPFTIVLTASTARKYFGEANPMGQVLSLREPSDRDVFEYTVTGVMADLPAHSHMAFDFLASYVTQRQSQSQSWLGFGVYTYVKLREGTNANAVQAKLPALFATYSGPQIREAFGISPAEFEAAGNYYRYFLQAVPDIHLHSNLEDELKPTGDARLVYLFVAIAVFVLLLACVNFVNLATARAARRTMEVGIRKTLGAQRFQLVGQFLAESILLSLLALVLAVTLVQVGVSLLSAVTGKMLTLTPADLLRLTPILLGLGLLVGLGAGAYPAFYVAAFRPIAVLKQHGLKRRTWLRDVLVVFQFGIATALIACTAIVYTQTQYMLDKRLGFTPEQVVVIEGAEVIGPQGEAFRQAMRALPGVVRVTNAEQVPGRYFNGSRFRMADAADDESIVIEYTYASFDYVETLGLELVAGRSLSRDYATDSLAVLLNETAVQQLRLDDPIGKQLHWPGESTYTIVGVVKDFHITSLHREIGAVALLGPDPRNTNRPNLLAPARLQTDNLPQTLASIEALWTRFAPQEPFVYTFLDETFAQLYEAEQRTSRLITLFAGLAILIACFGLFGLAAYMAEQRTKEIGIRKVFGATVSGIVLLLSKDFARLVLVAIVLGAPLAYLTMQRWLEGFAYRVEISWRIFLVAGLGALVVALVTVSYQAVRAALADPVESLRYE